VSNACSRTSSALNNGHRNIEAELGNRDTHLQHLGNKETPVINIITTDQYREYSETFEKCGQIYINKCAHLEVSEVKSIEILGYLTKGRRRTCLQLALPSFTQDQLDEENYETLCLIERNGRYVAAIVLLPGDRSLNLTSKPQIRIDLSSIRHELKPLLEEFQPPILSFV
jgi:hypothetical protein